MSFSSGARLRSRPFLHLVRMVSILALLLLSLVVALVSVRTPTRAASSLVLEYADANTLASTNTPRPHFEIANTTTTSVSLSSLTIRYWYTADGTQSQQFACDYALVGCSTITSSFVTLGSASADTYLQIGFTSGAGNLAANGNTGDIQARFNKSDWSNYNQANDYSWNQNQASYAPADVRMKHP